MPTDDPDYLVTGRQAFVEARRSASRGGYNAVFASATDDAWVRIAPSHARSLGRVLRLTRARGTVLDAACGQGKYWSDIMRSGRSVVGTDQLVDVLEVAHAAHPEVPTARLALQDLAFDSLFDAVICIDALEDLVPEDWPAVLGALVSAARPDAPLYLTVELSEPGQLERVYERARAAGHPVILGERFDGAGYHYYPSRDAVYQWLTGSGLESIDESDGDGYWHLILRRTVPAE